MEALYHAERHAKLFRVLANLQYSMYDLIVLNNKFEMINFSNISICISDAGRYRNTPTADGMISFESQTQTSRQRCFDFVCLPLTIFDIFTTVQMGLYRGAL